MGMMKVLRGVLLIGCLIPTVTLSPIKGKKDDLVSQPSRHRVKTVGHASSNHHSSESNRFLPDPNSPVAHFDSRPIQPSSEATGKSHQFTQQKENSYDFDRVTQPVNDQVTQSDQHFQLPVVTPTQAPVSVEQPGTQARKPISPNFGDRIQSNDHDSQFSKCLRKGDCSAITFTSGEKFPTSSGIQATGAQRNTVTSSQQQNGHDETRKSEETGVFEFGQSKDSYEDDRQIPNQSNFNGQVSVQDNSQFTQSHIPSVQDEQFRTTQSFLGDGNQRIFNEQNENSFKSEYETQSQLNRQSESPDYGVGQQQYDNTFAGVGQNTYDGQDERRQTFSSDVTPQQQFESVAPEFEVQQSYEGDSQFQHSVTQVAPNDFFSGSQDSQNLGTQKISGQSRVSQVSGGSHQGHDDGQYYHDGNPVDWLQYNVPGTPGEDYPILYQVPATSFNCKQQQFSAGIFGDTEASCQVFHICKENGGQASFLCPNGTVFNQQYFVCDWWYNFRCADTPSFYNLNSDLYWDWESFTPTQVLNGPSVDLPNFQSGSSGNFDRVSADNDLRNLAQNEGQNEAAVKSAVAIDNTAVIDKSRNDFEQRYQDEGYSHEQTLVPNSDNIFSNAEQDFHQQTTQDEYPSSFTPSFTGTTAGFQPVTTSPLTDNFGNVPKAVDFSIDNNNQGSNNFQPLSSDTGANRRPGGNTGTNYPDQSNYRQQFPNVLQTQEQSQPSFDANGQNHREFSNNAEGIVSDGRPVTQDFVSVSFDNQNKAVDDATYRQTTESDYESGRNTVQPFDINQQTFSDTTNSGGNYDSRNQEIQQDHISASFDRSKPGDLSSNRNDDIQNAGQNIFHGQDQNFGSFVNNEDNRVTGVHNIYNTQTVQQEDISSTSFGNTPASFDTDDGHVTLNENSDVQGQGVSFDVNQQGTLSDDGRYHNGFNQEIHQQTIINPFEGKGPSDLDSGTVSDKSDTGNFGSSVSGVHHDNKGSRQTQGHISTVTDDQHTEFHSKEENYNSNIPHGKGQKEDTRSFQSTNQGSHINDGDFGRHSEKNNQNLQQQNISPSIEDSQGNTHDTGNSGHQGFDDGRTRGSQTFQTNDQSSFTEDRNNNNQYEVRNKDVQQEYVSVTNNFENNQRGSFFNDNQPQSFVSTNEDNRNQIFQQEHIPNAFDQSRSQDFQGHADQNRRDQHVNPVNRGSTFIVTERPNLLGNRVTFPGTRDDQGFQRGNTFSSPNAGTSPSFNPENTGENQDTFRTTQGQTIPPFSTTEQGTFELGNRDISHGRDKNQENIQFDVQQKDITTSFVETRPNGNVANENYPNNQPNNGFVTVQNQGSPTSGHNHASFEGDSKFEGQNTPEVHAVQQEHIPTSFGNEQSNNFGQWRGVTNQGNQGHAFVPDQRMFQITPQNNFGVSGQQNIHFNQNLNQEHVNIPFIGNQEHNINAQNIFIQGEHGGQEQIQQQHQTVSFNGNGQNAFEFGNVDANAAFERRLNNFRPVNMHEMGRGRVKEANHMTQRTSFRPYGQNQQTNVNSHQIQRFDSFSSRDEQHIDTAYSNQRSPSNQNFFVTNGHQVQNEQQKKISQQSLSSDKPLNNIQGQSEQHAPHISQQYVEDQSNPLTASKNDQNVESQKSNTVHFPTSKSGSASTNSQVKVYSSNESSRNGRSINFNVPLNSEINSQAVSAVSVNANDGVSYNQPEPQSTEINYNGWRPVVKY